MQNEKADPLLPLFIADEAKGRGIIMAAERRYSRDGVHPYIWATVDCGGADQISCVISRAAYTWAVLSFGWRQDQASEVENIANLVGREVTVKWQHKLLLDGKTVAHLVIRGFGEKPHGK